MYGTDWTAVDYLVSNGPLRLEIWQPGESIRLVRNPYYHGNFNGNIQNVDIHFELDWQERLAKYAADELDCVQIPELQVHNARARYPGEFYEAQIPSSHYALFNTQQEPLDDLRVRLALCMAVDVRKFSQEVFGGIGTPAEGGFIPPDVPGHSPSIALPNDPARERRLLAEAGYPEGTGLTNLQALGESVFTQYLKYIQDSWREVLGVDVTWKVCDPKMFPDRITQETPHMIVSGWGADYPDPDNFRKLLRRNEDEVFRVER